MQSDPSNRVAQGTLVLARDFLGKLQNNKIQGAKMRARINWLEHGDKGSRYFFQLLKFKEARDKIELVTEESKLEEKFLIKKLSSMHLAKLYASLFTSKENGLVMEEERRKIKSHIPKKVPREDRLRMNQPILKKEIVNALTQMSNDKGSGPDGIPVEFYKTHVE